MSYDKYRCPITLQIFSEPVVASDGHVYEEEALIKCINQHNNMSPITRQKITSYNKCIMIKDEVNEYIRKNPELKKDIYPRKINDKDILNILKQKDTVSSKQLIDDIQSDSKLEFEYVNKHRLIHFICQYSTPEMIKYVINFGV